MKCGVPVYRSHHYCVLILLLKKQNEQSHDLPGGGKRMVSNSECYTHHYIFKIFVTGA